jgi:hypothetical protein
MKRYIFYFSWRLGLLHFIIISFSAISCKKFVNIDPPRNLIVSADVYQNDITAIGVVRGIYSQMVSNSGGFASGSPFSISLLCGLSADEFKNFSSDPGDIAFYTNGLRANNFSDGLWDEPYKYINIANSIMEGLNGSASVTPATKSELIGEAKFIRAFCLFYLTNLFGDVPIITSTNYSVNASFSRQPANQVNKQIINDLVEAEELLSPDFSYSNGERDQPNRFAAAALLARTYLYTAKWDSAEIEATKIINESGTYGLVADPDSVFLANSREAIWQLRPTGSTINTMEGNIFILNDYPTYVSISDNLLSSFELNDRRREDWIDSVSIQGIEYYFPYKYKVKAASELTEYSMILRLAEQYLIRSEARAEQNNITGAQEDLNIIRNRSNLPNTTASDKESILDAIYHERQVELFSEWGHRWLDLKRSGRVDSVMSEITQQKGGSWKSQSQLYPIPQSELNIDANLIQNPGY